VLDTILYPLDWHGTLLAVLCGGLIGLERQLRGRPAGIRTSMLICLGTQTFVILGQTLIDGPSDRGRVLGQVITGIGFLGGGVILAHGGLVYGVTSASAIWMLAAIGSVIGLGHKSAGLALTLLTIAILVVVDLFEAQVMNLRKGVHSEPDAPLQNKE
jgi:putative Mg2+ transporter-C (MgtC) family protein